MGELAHDAAAFLKEAWVIARDRVVLLSVSAAVLAFAAVLVWQEQRPGYRRYQAEFRSKVAQALGEERAAKAPDGPQQIWLASLNGTVDRCPSCHLGVGWKDLKDLPQPFAPHPLAPLAHHPVEKFGCTACHGGQGAATQLPEAHGWVEHWEDPLLDRTLAAEYGAKDRWAFLQTRCNGCHRYDQHIEGAELVNQGKRLVDAKGCRACHAINGRGGSVGPDLTRVGDKPAEQYDFSRLGALRSLFAWHVGHLQNPKSFSPTTVMPEFGFATGEAQSIALVLMSWRDQRWPAEYLPGARLKDVPSPEQAERERLMREGEGRFFVEKTCFVCHDVTALGVESATKIGPDLSLAVDDVPRRFGRPLEDFLKAPSGTMEVVLARQITLTEPERAEAARLLHLAFERHQAKAKPEK